MIWRYDDRARSAPVVNTLSQCIFCGNRKDGYYNPTEHRSADEHWFPFGEQARDLGANVLVCPNCGWWIVYRVETSHPGGEARVEEWAAAGALKNLSLTDISTPLEDVQQYLVARYGDRYSVHPRVFEEVVGSVFRSLGYDARVTAYSGDDGIDVMILDRSDGEQIGVQVKRQRDKIQACQIRELAGALKLNDATKGIFITTAHYTKGAEITARKYGERNLPIELWDAQRFYDALKLSARPKYSSLWDPEAPFAEVVRNIATLPKTRDGWLSTGW